MEHDDFELQIGPWVGDEWLVRVLRSPAGEGEGSMRLPGVVGDWGVPRHARPIAETVVPRSPAEVGGALFRALFSAEVGELFHQSLTPGRGLRLRLRINPRDRTLAPLHHIPWELLYRDETDDFLALSRATPLVRSLAVPRPSSPAPIEPPLRVLVVPAQAPGTDQLDLSGELALLLEALGRDPQVEVVVLDSPESSALRRALGRTSFHVLHYMGHGAFDPRTGEGTLLVHGANGGRAAISGRHLATKLKDAGSLRLVVLNACETAVASAAGSHDPVAGVATALVMAGVPAVVAMQSPIEDTKAAAFSAAFYDRLADGLSIEEAVTEGRQAIHSLDADGADWAIPVLFMRSAAGELGSGIVTRPAETGTATPVATRTALRRHVPWLAGSSLAAVLSLVGVGWWLGLEHEPESPPLKRAAIPEKPLPEPTPVRNTVPAGQTVTVAGIRFEVVATATPISSTLADSLRRASASIADLAEAGLAGATVHLQVGAPQLIPGAGRTTCRLTSACRLRHDGAAIDLRPASATRANALDPAACEAAAAELADVVVRELARHLQGGMT